MAKRRIWIWVGAALAGLIVLTVSAVGAGYLYLEYRNAGWLRDALAAYDKGEWQRAKGYFERYLPQDPKNAELLLKYADACVKIREDRVGSLQGAVTAYQQILTYQQDNDDVRKKLIELYVKLSAWSTLDYYTEDWLKRSPEDENLLYHRALALDHVGKQDEALELYGKLVQSGTNLSDVYGSYARLLRDKGLETKADEVFAKAREARPTDGHILVDHARFIARKSTWSEVQHLLEQALAESPEDYDVLVAVAQASMLRKQHAQAVELLNRAVKVNPQNSTAYLMLASAYVYQGLFEDAIGSLKQIDPFVQADTPLLLIMLADLQLGMSAFDDAKQTIDAYNQVVPEQLAMNEYFKAKELLVRGEPSEAIKHLSSVISLRPGFILAQYTLAEAYLASGETELARSTLETYLSKNTSDERAQRLMAQRFGRPLSIETLSSRAADLVAAKETDAQRLTQIASALLDAAVRQDQLDQHADVIRTTLEMAIERDPALPIPYRVLANLSLWQRHPQVAAAVLDRAKAVPLERAEFGLLRAAIAFAEGNDDAAEAIIAAAIAEPDFDYLKFSQWAGFLAEHGHYDRATALLEEGINSMEASEAKAALEVDRTMLALRRGLTADVESWLLDVEPRIEKGTSLRRRYNAARLQLAQTILITNPEQDAEQSARKLVAAVREEDPGNPSLQVSDGLMLLRKQPPDYDGAQALFERAVAADGSNVGGHWGLARVAFARADYPRALTSVERAASLTPDVPSLQLLQAEALLKTDRLFEADRVLRRLIERRPDDPAVLQMYAECLLQRGKVDEARAAVTRLEGLPGAGERYEESLRDLKGSLLVAAGETEKAESELRKRFEAAPDDLKAVTDLATVVMKQGRASEAKSLLMRFAEEHGGNPESWVAIAEWWGRTEDESKWREASTGLTRALLVDPDYIPAIRAMLAIRLRQGDLLEALGLCARYLVRNPDDADMLNTKALLLTQSRGRLNEALASANRAVELDDRPEYLGTRGVVLVSMQQYERALRDLNVAAREMETSKARIDAALAEAYMATNDLPRAREHLDAAVTKADSGEFVDRDRLRQLQELLQKKEAAA